MRARPPREWRRTEIEVRPRIMCWSDRQILVETVFRITPCRGFRLTLAGFDAGAVRMRQVLGWSGATSVAITEGQRARICSRLSWDS